MKAKEILNRQFLLKIFKELIVVKFLFLFILLVGLIKPGFTQTQLEVQGKVNSEDTVMIVRVNSNAMFKDVVGLDVYSRPASNRGIGGSFYGGNIGLKARSRYTAISAHSDERLAIEAISDFGVAGYFRGGDDNMDIVLGGSNWADGSNGDEGVIGISALKPSGDLWLISNDATVIHLDKNNDENGHLFIRNGEDDDVFIVDESGRVYTNGGVTIGENNTPPAEGLRVKGLSGNGTSPVFVDEFGNFSRNQDSIFWVSVDHLELKPRTGLVDKPVINNGTHAEILPWTLSPGWGGALWYGAPIKIPDGASIKIIKIQYRDYGINQLFALFAEYDPLANNSTEITSWSSNGSNNNVREANIFVDYPVQNKGQVYRAMIANQGDPGGTGQNGEIYGIWIGYYYP